MGEENEEVNFTSSAKGRKKVRKRVSEFVWEARRGEVR